MGRFGFGSPQGPVVERFCLLACLPVRWSVSLSVCLSVHSRPHLNDLLNENNVAMMFWTFEALNGTPPHLHSRSLNKQMTHYSVKKMLGSRWFQMDRLPPEALDNIAFCLGGNDDTTGWFHQLFVWAITFWQLWASWYREFYSTWYWDRSSNLNVPLWRLAPSRLMAPSTSLFVPYYLIPRCLSRMFQEPRRYIWRCMSMFMHVSLKTHNMCMHT